MYIKFYMANITPKKQHHLQFYYCRTLTDKVSLNKYEKKKNNNNKKVKQLVCSY